MPLLLNFLILLNLLNSLHSPPTRKKELFFPDIVKSLWSEEQTCPLRRGNWGFYAHQRINYFAVFLLPPEMIALYKPNIIYISEHAVDPDKRRYAVPEEGPRHYIDLDRYGRYPFDSLPRGWTAALARYGQDSLNAHGIVPWWIQTMLGRLTDAFRDKDKRRILQYSAEIGHYIADAHVPLHACSNHNGQYTGQHGIHGFWESRIPELLAEKNDQAPGWDFLLGHADYIAQPLRYTWDRVLESAAAADTVLRTERELTRAWPADRKYAFEERNGLIIRQYSSAFSRAYDQRLRGMIERRMQQSVYSVASFWYTAWINAGQPSLLELRDRPPTAEEEKEMAEMNRRWREKGSPREEH